MKFLLILFLLPILSCSKKNSNSRSLSSITEFTQKYNIPGMAQAFVKDGKMMELNVWGVRKYGSPAMLAQNDLFHLGSCSKAMTATLAAQFIEEGKLDWKTPLSDLLPDMSLHPSFSEMSFETLLVHRAGLPVNHHDLFVKVSSMNPTLGRELITRTLLEQAPVFRPDSRYSYTNFSYIIAGHILEKISGESWENLMKQKIFIPLEMKSCGFGVTSLWDELLPGTNWGHVRRNGIPEPRHYDNPEAFGPSSTVHCNLLDWSKFLTMHASGYRGESDFLKKETFSKLHATHPLKDSNYTYGGWLRLERSWAAGATLSHAGSNTLNYAIVWIAPEINSVLMSTVNIGGDEAMRAADEAIEDLISSF